MFYKTEVANYERRCLNCRTPAAINIVLVGRSESDEKISLCRTCAERLAFDITESLRSSSR